MARYKRGRRFFRKSTNVIKMKFQSFFDLSTNASSMQVLTVSAGGPEIVKRLAPQFGAYKYYKIGNISIKLVPASTLPVDPTGLSITAGDNLVDPRDQLTPGMMRITNGEDVFEDISGLSDDQQRGIYNNMLLDPRWFKWMLQSGVKRHAFPKYWQIGQLHQDKWPGAIFNMPAVDSSGQPVGTSYNGHSVVPGTGELTAGASVSSEYGFFQTGHKGTLGWLPTDGLQKMVTSQNHFSRVPFLASPPEIEVFKILLPKAYKTRYWYRAFVSETVYFKEPIVNFGITAGDGYDYRPLDVFHRTINSDPLLPSDSLSSTFPDGSDTGGNYGNN